MQAGRIDAVKNASNYDNNSVQNQRVMRPQRGPEQLVAGDNRLSDGTKEFDRGSGTSQSIEFCSNSSASFMGNLIF